MNLKLTKEQLINSILDSIEILDDDILAKDYNLDYYCALEKTKSIDDRIRMLNIEGCMKLLNELKEMIKEQEETTGYAKPATGAYYEYMFYRVPNAETIGKTKTHNK